MSDFLTLIGSIVGALVILGVFVWHDYTIQYGEITIKEYDQLYSMSQEQPKIKVEINKYLENDAKILNWEYVRLRKKHREFHRKAFVKKL